MSHEYYNIMFDKLDFTLRVKDSCVRRISDCPKTGALRGTIRHEDFDLPFRNTGQFVDGVVCYDAPSSHIWDSIPSSLSSVAIGIFVHGNGFLQWPHVVLKSSPAKILQGHNVYGSECFKQGFFQMLMILNHKFPVLYDALDIDSAVINYIDVTYSASVPNHNNRSSIFRTLELMADKRSRINAEFSDYIQIGVGSAFKRKKVYYKAQELMADTERALKSKNMVRYNILSDPELISFASDKLRFEGTLGKAELRRIGVPTLIKDFLKYDEWSVRTHSEPACRFLWRECFGKLLRDLGAMTITMIDDKTASELIFDKFSKIRSDGSKCQRLANSIYKTYCSIRAMGFDNIKLTSTVYKHLSYLKSIGMTRSYLRSIGQNTNVHVMPIRHIINIDFGSQVPESFVPPLARPFLSLVS